uniref:Mu-like prophage protein gp29 n=1 Tax=Candidatus Kentrum sp. TC TaxID=2126339 RepID=A0A450ZT57_9GAMM|nr:MAG: Mu-like prophage protein gp29 [Candidatus Kentron sp. TC]
METRQETKRPTTGRIATRNFIRQPKLLLEMLPNPDPILKARNKDIDIYRDIAAESQVSGNIRRRESAVKALEWGIDGNGAPKRVVSLIESFFTEEMDMDAFISDALESTTFGYKPIEVIWGRKGRFWTPASIIGKPPEWFRYDNENRLRFMSKSHPTQGEILPPRKFLTPRQKPSYDNPYGIADMSLVYWPVVFKKGGISFWLDYAERFGGTNLIGKVPPGASQEKRDALLSEMEQMLVSSIAVIEDDKSIEHLESGGKGGTSEVFESLSMFLRAEINFAQLGQNQSSEASSTNASAQAGLKVATDIRDANKRIVAATANTLIQWICHYNFLDAGLPRFRMWEQEEVDKAQAERDRLLHGCGARFTNQYFERAYGFQPGDLEEPENGNADNGREDKTAATDARFAEDDARGADDQRALDEAISESTQSGIGRRVEDMIQPALSAISGAKDYDEAWERLIAAYPDMNDGTLREALETAMFAAQSWGYANGVER